MARRRLTPDEHAAQQAARAALTDPPEHLRTCYIDDWIDHDEDLGLDTESTPADRLWRAQLVARRRFLDARKQWTTDLLNRGLAPPDLPPCGRPRRRPATT